MIQLFRNRLMLKCITAYVILAHGVQIFAPNAAYALTGGPSQPEVQSFEPLGVSEMVNVSSGDFTYSIPLMDVEGYPITLSYHSGITMDQEPTSVGLGWNLNVGVLNRNMRGLPDDFKGDPVTKEFKMKANQTWGLTGELGFQLFGFKNEDKGHKERNFQGKLNVSLGVFYNNYKGMGTELGVNFAPSLAAGNKGKNKLTAGLGITANSQTGANANVSLGWERSSDDAKNEKNGDITYLTTKSFNGSLQYNSRNGLKAISFTQNREREFLKDINDICYKDGRENRGGGSTISFGTNGYTPSSSFPFSHLSTNFAGTAGTELFGGHPSLTFSGYYVEQRQLFTKQTQKAYGFLQLHTPDNLEQKWGLLDFNREKDGPFIPYRAGKEENGIVIKPPRGTPNLPLAQLTFDQFSAATHGLSGSFRAYRSDIGTVHDPYVLNQSTQGAIGLEAGVGNAAHIGVDVNVNTTISSSGRWGTNKGILDYAKFSASTSVTDPLYEPYYFKQIGELNVEPDQAFLDKMGNDKLVRVRLLDVPRGVTENKLEEYLLTRTPGDPEIGDVFTTTAYHRSERARRNQLMTTLTAKEAKRYGLDREIRSYEPFDSQDPAYDANGQLNYSVLGDGQDFREDHHISEVNITSQGGSRYVFGIPCYNTHQQEASFAIGDETPDCEGLVDYTSKEASTGNDSGRDYFYSSTELPPYAYAYLLTGILSADYVDRTQNGITDDDYGMAYKFNYSKLEEEYHWRAPYSDIPGKANYQEGFETKTGAKGDDKASFIYGKKQMWYVHSIESKNFIAEFTYEDALGGYGAAGRDGGVGTLAKPQQLHKITLYAKNDRKSTNGANATPIKTVHFKYAPTSATQLCREVPNNPTGGGKLTLDEVYFTYGKSNEARLSSYQFSYGDYDGNPGPDPAYNPKYHPKGTDCWGNYTEPATTACGPGDLPTWKFPFVNQKKIPSSDTDFYNSDNPDRTYADAYASAWNLNRIKLPTGGIMNIHYESKDYAYVQDKGAMEMFFLEGVGPSPTSTPTGDQLFTPVGYSSTSPAYSSSNVIFVKLHEEVADDQEFKKRYLRDLLAPNLEDRPELFFNCRIAVNKGSETPRKYEHIAGYARIIDAGLTTDKAIGWIKLLPRTLKGENIAQAIDLSTISSSDEDYINPITYTAWSFIKQSLPELIHSGSDPQGTGESALKGLLGFAMDIKTMFTGYHNMLRGRQHANKLVPNRSWVRLYSPQKMKKGGGARVHKVTLTDNWNEMAGGKDAIYGQTYNYTIDNPDFPGESMSSGVAANEPSIGREQNPLIQPKRYQVLKPWHQSDEITMEGPMGEMYMPAPQIVYSKVKVQDLQHDDITRNKTGYVVHEFYTAKDYPVIFEETPIDPRRIPKVAFSLFDIVSMDFYAGTQGYVIRTNDMHGKPKKTLVYGQGTKPISGSEYFYRTKDGYSSDKVNRLDNDGVEVIHPDNTKGTATIGKEIEVTIDERQSNAETFGLDAQANGDGFFIGIIPVFIPIALPKPSYEKTRFRSIVLTKAVRHFAILEEVIAYDRGAEVSTKNLAWDAETGAVLLTQTNNEFDQDVYGMSYPTHWAYDRMGPAAKNVGAVWNQKSLDEVFDDGVLVKGDELLLKAKIEDHEFFLPKVWVLDPDPNVKAVVSQNGTIIDRYFEFEEIKVLRSGRRNLQGGSMGSIVAKADPTGTTEALKDPPTNVLSSSAVEFEEVAQQLCGVPTWECTCRPTLAAQHFLNLLNDLRDKGTWLHPTGTSIDGPFFTQTLITALGADINASHTWRATITNSPNGCDQDFTIYIEEGTNTLATIAFTYSAASPYCLDFIDRFTNVRGASQNCTAGATLVLDAEVDVVCGDEIETSVFAIQGTATGFTVETCGWGWVYPCTNLGDVINPFLAGLRGQWHPKVSYAHLTGRTMTNSIASTVANPQTDLSSDGEYTSFDPFWEWNSTTGAWEGDATNWTWTAEVSKHLVDGPDIEERNPLNPNPIYSTALFGYQQQLPVAVAANARFHEIAYEHFELSNELQDECKAHTWFRGNGGDPLDFSTLAHSGRQSVLIEDGESMTMTQSVNLGDCTPEADDAPYHFKECDCAGSFSPQKEERYIATLWVRSDVYNNVATQLQPSDYDDITVTISTDGQAITPAPTITRGNIIEGWQRLEVDFVVPNSASESFEFKVSNTSTTDHAYVDDIRIHPYHASMKTFVYDATNLRLMAEGDDKGYCTFYQLHQQEGSLKGVKRETARGIMTLSENVSNVARNQP